MKRVPATEAKNRVGAILDDAQREPVVIRRQDRDIAVVLSMADSSNAAFKIFRTLRSATQEMRPPIRIPHPVTHHSPQSRVAVRSEPRCGEHVLKAFQDRDNNWAFELAKRRHEALNIDSAKLIERNDARAALKAASRTPRIHAPASGHGRHDDPAEVFVQFVRRHDHSGPRLLDFATQRWIEPDRPLGVRHTPFASEPPRVVPPADN